MIVVREPGEGQGEWKRDGFRAFVVVEGEPRKRKEGESR